MTDLHHFYHIYCKGSWETPTYDHIKALKEYGLLDSLSSFQVGLVGPENKREEVKKFLLSENINFSVCTEVDDGWEQETQDQIHSFAQDNDGYILYAHTKNAVNINDLHVRWRLSMTYFNIVRWKDCVQHLDEGFSAVGCHYLEGGNENVKTSSGFFAGTYWWTHLKYIKKFPLPDRSSRYGAEGWIGWLKSVVDESEDNFTIYDYVPYHPGMQSGMVSQW